MPGRVTIQDIADALGVSRNTVSKAINNTGILADATREKILKKAVEMGYKQFSYVTFNQYGSSPDGQGGSPTAGLLLPGQKVSAEHLDAAEILSAETTGTIAMLSSKFLGSLHFSAAMLEHFESRLSRFNYGLAMYRVSPQNIEQKTLPSSIHIAAISGIICFEMFDPPYCNMLCELGVPVLFVDCPSPFQSSILKADILLMENRGSIFTVVREMVRRGKKRIGFIGEYTHCRSFFERYMGVREAMLALEIPFQEEFFILGNKSVSDPSYHDYREYLEEHLRSLKSLPDLFICANDFVAFDVMNIFESMNVSIPEDVSICGFDDSPESRLVTPGLSTVHIHSHILGITAVQLLLSRIKNPTLNYRTVYTETTPIYRASTGD